MPLAILTLFTGLSISVIAIYYSVLGLASIFSAAAIPIMVMGAILEVSKLVSAWWLKANWHRAPYLLKSYMLIATVVLMLITSMGIFGFLSKAHSDQAVPAGDAVAKIQIIDEKIAIETEVIAQYRKDLETLNTQIDKFNELGAVSKGVAAREKQKGERDRIFKKIEDGQTKITKLREERAPIATSVRAIEAEVGPIKYIAAFVYGDNPDANILEKAVTWVIITIVFVFDPLAVLLLLASQMSFAWAKEQKETTEGDSPTSSESVDSPTVTTSEQEEVVEQSDLPKKSEADEVDLAKVNSELRAIEPEINEFVPPVEEPAVKEKDPVAEWNEIIAEAELAVIQEEDLEIIESAAASEKAAMRRWKEENPEDSLKHQRKLFERGTIAVLPWDEYIKETVTFDDEAAEEAAKWALEQTEKKNKTTDVSWMETENGQQVKKSLDSYQQNAEQNESTLWQRVKKAKDE